MDDDWEKNVDGNGTVSIPKPPFNLNKWEGEDEDDVKDSWEDEEEEEKKDEEKSDSKVVKIKPKKALQEKIEERERLRREELEAKERERIENMTPEEKAAEKLRLQKVQEESDLRAAMETFGVTTDGDKVSNGIDAMNPTNKSELSEFCEALSKKISQYKTLDDFPGFLEELVRNVCVNVSSNDLQKIKKTVDNLYLEKQKMDKEKSKKGAKGKVKAKLRLEGANAAINDFGDSYDYDDFM